jgi:hypothetical protein
MRQQWRPALKANAKGNGMDEDGEGPNIKYRKIEYSLPHFMPSLPPTLLSLCPHSHASCLPWLVVVLPLVIRPLRFLSCHHLPSGGTSTCPLLLKPLPLIIPPFFSGALAPCLLLSHRCFLSACTSASHCTATSHCAPLASLVRLVVALTLILPMPLLRRRLKLSSCQCLFLRPSRASCPLWLVVL